MKILDIISSPWAIAPECLREIRAVYASHLRGDKVDWPAIEAAMGAYNPPTGNGYDVVDGVAVIPIQGPLSKGSGFLRFLMGGMSVDEISMAFDAALDDLEAKAIMLQINSPGGSVLGVQELATQIYDARGRKPITAYCDGVMASAACWIGTAADRVYISGETNMTGHIGVIWTHHTNEWEGETKFYAGRYKHIDAGGKLSEEDKEVLQARVDYVYSIFVADVAKFRGVPVETVLSTMAEGRVFIGRQAVTVGLVDGVSTFDRAVAAGGELAIVQAFSKFRKGVEA